jgi:hypothetical protein
MTGVEIINCTNITYSLNGSQIIEVYHYFGEVAYWAPSPDGIILFYLEQAIVANYSGIILYYDSTANEQFRTVILYNLT